MSGGKHNLIKIIAYDIFHHGVLSLILLMVIIMSAISIVTISYQTRLLTTKKNLMTEQKDSLDIEWRHLILEENVLGKHSRIESLSLKRLKMIHIDPIKEHIVIAK